MSDNSGEGHKTARREIIEEAQIKCHFARSEYQQQSKLYDGEIPRELVMRLQQAVTDYYWALRPLRDEAIIKDFWKETPLSEDWTYTTEEVRPRVKADLYGGGIDIVEEPVRVEKPLKGIDQIQKIDGQYETETVVKSDMRGRREEEVRRQKLLDPDILIDISGVLDDVTAKLGFGPSVKTEDPKDSPSMSDLRGLLQRRGQSEALEQLPEADD